MINLREVFIKNKEIAQLFYGILLIVLIIFFISFNSFSIIKKYKNGLNDSLKNQAYFYAKSVYSLLKNDLSDTIALQDKIDLLLDKNSEIVNFSILKNVEDSFEIVASTNKELIGKKNSFYLYKLAWRQPDYQGVIIDSYSINFANNENDRKFIEDLKMRGTNWFVALPMYDQSGNVKAIFSVIISSKFEDMITERNQINSLIITVISIIVLVMFLSLVLRIWDYAFLYKKVKEIDEMKDEFISMASHELRTPVTGIKGYSSMILDGSFGPISEQVKKSASIINSSANRLGTLVDDLLNVSRIEQGRMQLKTSTMNIYEIVNEVIQELKVQADQKKLELIYRPFRVDLPLIDIDADHLRQILMNLIGNSIKYTEAGRVEVIVEQHEKKLEIKIKDTGLGMSAEARDRLFQKFYRIKTEKTKNIIGTGLGLWITKQLIEMMKGVVTVESMEGVGSQFTVKFPIVVLK